MENFQESSREKINPTEKGFELGQPKRTKNLFEYWPWPIFYLPVYFRFFIDALRSGNFSYLGAVNPRWYLGGLWDYSKYRIQEELPSDLRPAHLLIAAGSKPDELIKKIIESGLDFPLIMKPDKGERGRGVKLVSSQEELLKMLGENLMEDFIIQDYVDHPVEAGILYYRIPGSDSGKISSFMIREFLTIKGDGNSTIRQILKSHSRYKRHIESIESYYPMEMEHVPSEGMELRLEPIGNHNRGTIFRNANRFITPDLEKAYDRIAKNLVDFYFGRLDIKAPDLSSLIKGENIKIIEVNGVNSEPAHIYDPDYGLLKAYRDLLKNWKLIYRISKENHKLGFSYPQNSELAKSFFKRLRN